MVEEIEMETGTQLMKAGCHCYWSRLPDSNRGPPDYKSHSWFFQEHIFSGV